MTSTAPDNDEDAANLSFGPEFRDQVECLSDVEVTVMLDNLIGGANRPALKRGHDYVKRSLGRRSVDSAKKECIHLRQALTELRFDDDDSKLHPFEIASLANLMSKDSEPEEARALIPSLRRFSDDVLAEILGVINEARAT